MKALRKCIAALTACLLVISCIPAVSADVVLFDYGDYYCGYENCEVTIRGYKGSEENLVIPDTINGYPVRTLKQGAFRNNNI